MRNNIIVNKLAIFWIGFISCLLCLASQLSVVAWAQEIKPVNATAITDRLSSTTGTNEGLSGSNAGLGALKELLFDEMVLFTVMGAMVLLVALIGAAIIISKRRDIHN